jgi:hypothetical protein
MKLKLYLFAILFGATAQAQQNKFIGTWEGKIEAGVSLRIAFHFSYDSTGKFIATMDSPDQSAFGLPTDEAHTANDSVFTGIKKYQVSVRGKLTSDSTIDGIFKQTAGVPLHLKKVSKVTTAVRKQTPIPPFNYTVEDVSFPSANKSVQIGATLTAPKNDPNKRYIKAPVYPAILLVTGSGPQDRDETMMGHKPFAVIADYLTKKGFIVLRMDDRGIGKSTGNFTGATSADFADDLTGALDFVKKLKNADTTRIGILGHSEGGMIAPLVASRRKDIDFLILLAAPGVKIIDLMATQNTEVLLSSGIGKEAAGEYRSLYKTITMAIVNSTDSVAANVAATNALDQWMTGETPAVLAALGLDTEAHRKQYVHSLAYALSGPWFKYFLNFDPQPGLRKLQTKVLALNGDKDIQVVSTQNLAGIEAALKKSRSPKYDVMELPGLNHLFQHCIKCTTREYGALEETISPEVLDIIGNWLVKNVL